jgi:hypothetical protein
MKFIVNYNIIIDFLVAKDIISFFFFKLQFFPLNMYIKKLFKMDFCIWTLKFINHNVIPHLTNDIKIHCHLNITILIFKEWCID